LNIKQTDTKIAILLFSEYFFIKFSNKTILALYIGAPNLHKNLTLSSKMKNKKYNIVETVLKSNRKIVEKGKIDTLTRGGSRISN
jgi:hypothetical protein